MNLIKSTTTFSFFTLISRIFGYVRDLLLAIYLGSGPVADAFFVAFRIPNTFRRLFSEGTFNAAFVPSYSSELAIGKKNSQNFANKIFNILLVSLLAVVLIIEIFMPGFIFIIAPGFNENNDKLELTILLTRITFPFLFFVNQASRRLIRYRCIVMLPASASIKKNKLSPKRKPAARALSLIHI